MYKQYPMGKEMPADLLAWTREQFYYLENDPITGKERLFFDNSGGSFRLKVAEEAFRAVDSFPNSYGHGGATSDYLDSLRVKAVEDMKILFHPKDGCLMTSQTASIVMFDVSGYIIENIPGTNVVTTELEHPSAFDGCAANCMKYGKELRVAKTNPKTGNVDPEEVLKLIDENTTMLSVIMTSNITGATLDIEAIAKGARRINPDIYIVCDAVQHAPHGIVDMAAAELDAVNFAPYKFGGLRGLGVGWLSNRVMNLPHRKVILDPPQAWELGGCASGMYAVLSAMVDHVCYMGKYFLPEETDRRTLYLKGMETIMLQERALLARLLYGSENQKGVLQMKGVYVPIDMSDLTRYDLILPLIFEGRDLQQVAREYEERGVVIHERMDNSHYSARQVNSIGEHGIIRVSPIYCHTMEEVDRFLRITEEML